MLHPLDDLKVADMPAKAKPNWAYTGPGAILVGLSIGAGEIIVWPRTIAEFGAGMIWAAALGVFIQLWLNFEIGRWTIATSETAYTGFARVWQGFAPIMVLLTVLGWLAPGWARASGSALKALLVGPTWQAGTFWGSDTCWTIITFGLVALVVFGPRVIYKSVEITIEILVVIVTVGLIILAIKLSTTDLWVRLGRGLMNIGYIDPAITVKRFFIILVFAGAGGTANLFYSFYLRDKHIGMAQRIPSMHNPLRGKAESPPATGFRFEDSPENATRFKSWFRFVVQDQVLYFWGLNTLTILLFIFAALAVLWSPDPATRQIPQEGSLIWDQAQILGTIWGSPGRIIFLLVGVATLFSTQLALLDGASRSIADMIYTNFRGARRREVGWWYVVIAISWMVIGCAITFIMERYRVTDLGFLLNASYMGGFAMAIYAPLTLYMNLRYLPRSARPGWLCTIMTAIVAMIYVGFAVACIYWEIESRLK